MASPDERQEENQPDDADEPIEVTLPVGTNLESLHRRIRKSSLLPQLSIPRSQNLIDPDGTTRKVTLPQSENEESNRRPVVRVAHTSRQAHFYSITESEIENYAQFGFLSSISLTLFGTFAGFIFGCLVALIQGNLSEASTSVFHWLIGLASVVALVFLIAAIYLWRLQRSNAAEWKNSATE